MSGTRSGEGCDKGRREGNAGGRSYSNKGKEKACLICGKTGKEREAGTG